MNQPLARKFGRRPPKNAPALMLAPLLTGTVPDHPVSADTFTVLHGSWQLLGNDTYGDCVAVTWANYRRVMTHQAGAERYPTLADVETVYRTQNPNFPADDFGMEIQTCLEYLVTTGGPDGAKAIAFAKVDHTQPDQVKAAIAIFGAVWVGINVLQANMAQFDQGQPWDYDPASPVDGGHSIIVGGYDSDNIGGDERFITWGAETSFTDAFWSQCVEEAWVVIWPEHLTSPAFLQGVDQAQLAADYQQITGRSFPVPAPPVPPAPPVDPDQTLAVQAHAWLDHHPHHRGLSNDQLRQALLDWLTAKGI